VGSGAGRGWPAGPCSPGTSPAAAHRSSPPAYRRSEVRASASRWRVEQVEAGQLGPAPQGPHTPLLTDLHHLHTEGLR